MDPARYVGVGLLGEMLEKLCSRVLTLVVVGVESLREGLGVLLRAFREKDQLKVRVELNEHLQEERPETEVRHRVSTPAGSLRRPGSVYSNSSRVL